MRKGKGDKPHRELPTVSEVAPPDCRRLAWSRALSHKAQGNKIRLAPQMRA